MNRTAAAPAAPGAEDGPGLPARPPAARMAIAVLALIGLLIAAYLALYKLGYLGVIQCTVGGCETVQSSQYALFLGVPVAVWGVGAYLTLLILAALGVQPRWVYEKWVALAIFGVAATGVIFSAYLTYLEAAVIQAWCQWCVVSAVIITLIFLLSLPGLRYAR